MAYLDTLSDNQLEALDTVLDELKSGSATTSIKDILEGAPALGKTTMMYRYYKTSSFKGNNEPDEMYSFKEKNYLVVSAKKLPTKSGATVLEFKMPAQTKAVPVGNDAFVLDKGTVYYIPDSDATWIATIKEAVALTASAKPAPNVFFNGGRVPERCPECGMSPIQEFYNRCHSDKDGKFCDDKKGGSGGRGNQRPQGGRGGGKPQVTPNEARLSRVSNVIRSVGTIVGVLGIVAGVINAYGTVNMKAGVRRQVRREGLLDREREKQKGRARLRDDDRKLYDYLKGGK